ncbi:MAG TPA: hypothetical protein VMU81_22990 [Acetobacteraceae bacterium]|jgi:hypothetical protein|nr:hypothetical protein [Acetobacteraceae bacterium]
MDADATHESETHLIRGCCYYCQIGGCSLPSQARDRSIEVVVLDGIDPQSDAFMPIQEAMKSIHDHSPLSLTADVIDSTASHTYTYWSCHEVPGIGCSW